MSSKIKIATIVGARPQFIKAAIVSQAIVHRTDCEEFYIHTGQHYDDSMSGNFFHELAIPEPKYNLMIGSGHHAQQTGRMMMGIEPILMSEKPDWVLIYGDTNSTLAGALVAAKLMIPIAHVEAGERSFEFGQPEEINRLVADRLSSLCFTATETAYQHLRNEGYSDRVIHPVGDVMFDAALFYGAIPLPSPTPLERLGLSHKEYGLVTVHRASNTDSKETIEAILRALDRLAENSFPLVFPVHPRTKAAARTHAAELWNKLTANPRLHIIEPTGFRETIALVRSAKLVITDSGGLQKEAYFHRTPCVTLRESTEWVDLVKLGWNHLATPLTTEAILATCQTALLTSPQPPQEIFGDGHAADRIIDTIITSSAAKTLHKR